MEYLKEYQVSLVDIIDYEKDKYAKLKREIVSATPGNHSYIVSA